VAIGAALGGSSDQGAVRVYEWIECGMDWYQVGSTIYGSSGGDHFGFASSLSDDGSVVAGGARFDSYVLVRTLDDTDWREMGQPLWQENFGDWFG
jgi:hypothetical protein